MTVQYRSMAKQKAEARSNMAAGTTAVPNEKPDAWAELKTKQFYASSDNTPCCCHLCGKPRLKREMSTQYRKDGSRKRMTCVDRYACGTKIVVDSKTDTEVLFGMDCIKPLDVAV